MDHKVNNIRLAWKLACMLSTYRTCNSTVGFIKYEFNNKLLSGVTLFGVTLLRVTPGVTLLRITLSVTWTQ